jgi:hypothetical protein
LKRFIYVLLVIAISLSISMPIAYASKLNTFISSISNNNTTSLYKSVENLKSVSLRENSIEWTFEYEDEYSYINCKLYDINGKLLLSSNTPYKSSPKSFFIRFINMTPNTPYKLVVTPYLNGKSGFPLEAYGITKSTYSLPSVENLKAVPIRTDSIEWTFDYNQKYSYINCKLYDMNGNQILSSNSPYKLSSESFFIRFINMKPNTKYKLVVTPYLNGHQGAPIEAYGTTK